MRTYCRVLLCVAGLAIACIARALDAVAVAEQLRRDVTALAGEIGARSVF